METQKKKKDTAQSETPEEKVEIETSPVLQNSLNTETATTTTTTTTTTTLSPVTKKHIPDVLKTPVSHRYKNMAFLDSTGKKVGTSPSPLKSPNYLQTTRRRLSASYADADYSDTACDTNSAYEAFMKAIELPSPITPIRNSKVQLESSKNSKSIGSSIKRQWRDDQLKPRQLSKHTSLSESDVAESLVKLSSQIKETNKKESSEKDKV